MKVPAVFKQPILIRLATVALLAVWLDSLAQIPFAAPPSLPSVQPPAQLNQAPALTALVRECERLQLPEIVDYVKPNDIPLEALRPLLKSAQELPSWPSACLNRGLGATWAVASHDWFTAEQPTEALQVMLASLNPMLLGGETPADLRLQRQCMRQIQDLLAEQNGHVTRAQVQALQATVEKLPSVRQTVEKAYQQWISDWASRQSIPRYEAQMVAEIELLIRPQLLEAVERRKPAEFLHLCVEDQPLVKTDPVMVELLSELFETWFFTQERNDQARVLVVLLLWKLDPQRVPQSPFADVHGRFNPVAATVWSDGINGKDEQGSEAPYMNSHAWMPTVMREKFVRRQMAADEVYRVGLR